MSNIAAPAHFANTRIVMVDTTHPGNIGGTARAMATMGFSQLALVNPAEYPSAKADEMAVGAKPLLDSAKVFTDFHSAVADCALIFGVTARVRDHNPPIKTVRQAMEEWVKIASHSPTAFVFGRERNGLENDVLWQCHRLVTIPVNPDFSSLNIASAVQILCYEARLAAIGDQLPASFLVDKPEPATALDTAHLIDHMERLMLQVGFMKTDKPMPIKARLRVMFHRLLLERQDIRLLRGFLKEVEAIININKK